MTRVLTVLSAGLGLPSSTRLLADRLAAAAGTALLEAEPQVEVEVRGVEVREHAHAVVDALLTGVPDPALAGALADVIGADALVVVTPTFQASFSGLFKAFVDLLPVDALHGRPVLLGATGGSTRHALVVEHALRPLFAYLRAVPTPTAVYAAPDDHGVGADALAARIDRAAQELAALVTLGARREAARERVADVMPFERRTAGGTRP